MPQPLARLLAWKQSRPPKLEPEILTFAPLSFTVGLQDLAFRLGRSMQIDVMSFEAALQDLETRKGHTLAADALSFAVGLQDLTLTQGHRLQADLMSTAAALQDLGLNQTGHVLAADEIAFTAAMQDVTLEHDTGEEPDPELNGTPAELLSASGTNHDITLALGEGTNRLVLISGGAQNIQLDWTSAVFDQGGADQAAMSLVADIRHSNDPIAVGLFSYLVPDEVEAGNKVMRIVGDATTTPVVFAAAFNNIGGDGTPSDFDAVEGNLQAANIVATSVDVVNTNDLVVSVMGSEINSLDYSPTGAATRLDLGGAQNGSASIFADGLAAAPATPLTVSWSRNAGAADHDLVVITAVFPHL